jgi:hypothetical protein
MANNQNNTSKKPIKGTIFFMPLLASTLRSVPKLTSVALDAKIIIGNKIHSIKNSFSGMKKRKKNIDAKLVDMLCW